MVDRVFMCFNTCERSLLCNLFVHTRSFTVTIFSWHWIAATRHRKKVMVSVSFEGRRRAFLGLSAQCAASAGILPENTKVSCVREGWQPCAWKAVHNGKVVVEIVLNITCDVERRHFRNRWAELKSKFLKEILFFLYYVYFIYRLWFAGRASLNKL